jgi:hypothetical protein
MAAAAIVPSTVIVNAPIRLQKEHPVKNNETASSGAARMVASAMTRGFAAARHPTMGMGVILSMQLKRSVFAKETETV